MNINVFNFLFLTKSNYISMDFIFAASTGNLAQVQKLYPKDINALEQVILYPYTNQLYLKGDIINMAFFLASENGDNGVLEYLLDKNIILRQKSYNLQLYNVDSNKSFNFSTGANLKNINCNVEMLQLLIKYGINVRPFIFYRPDIDIPYDLFDVNGESYLLLIIKSNQLDLIKQFLGNINNANNESLHQRNILSFTIKYGSIEALQLLLDYNFDLGVFHKAIFDLADQPAKIELLLNTNFNSKLFSLNNMKDLKLIAKIMDNYTDIDAFIVRKHCRMGHKWWFVALRQTKHWPKILNIIFNFMQYNPEHNVDQRDTIQFLLQEGVPQQNFYLRSLCKYGRYDLVDLFASNMWHDEHLQYTYKIRGELRAEQRQLLLYFKNKGLNINNCNYPPTNLEVILLFEDQINFDLLYRRIRKYGYLIPNGPELLKALYQMGHIPSHTGDNIPEPPKPVVLSSNR